MAKLFAFTFVSATVGQKLLGRLNIRAGLTGIFFAWASFACSTNSSQRRERNEYSLDHHNWVCSRGDRKIPLSRKKVRTFGLYLDNRARDCGSLCSNIPRSGGGVVSSWARRWVHRSNRWRHHSLGSVGVHRAT